MSLPTIHSVVSNFNLFLDSTSTGSLSGSTGDNYTCHLGADAITARDDQKIQLELKSFDMANVIHGEGSVTTAKLGRWPRDLA